MFSLRIAVKAAALTLGASLLMLGQAHASSTLNVTYFTISSSDPSYNTMCCTTVNDQVLSTLGPDGLPLLNPASSAIRPNAADLFDTAAGQEITWWSPALNPYVTKTGTDTVTLPINHPYNFFPAGTDNDYSGGLAAVYTGTLYMPTTSTISFSIGADDAAFLYLDGVTVCDLGGVHGVTTGYCVPTQTIAAGSHSIKLFFADLNASQSGLYADVVTQGVTVTATPEPAMWLMMLAGFGLIGVTMRRRVAFA